MVHLQLLQFLRLLFVSLHITSWFLNFLMLFAGKMKGIAFIKDPDDYWIEIFDLQTIGKTTLSAAWGYGTLSSGYFLVFLLLSIGYKFLEFFFSPKFGFKSIWRPSLLDFHMHGTWAIQLCMYWWTLLFRCRISQGWCCLDYGEL